MYDIYITGEIGEQTRAQDIAAQLQAFQGKACRVFISSLGGSVTEALEIYRLFRTHGQVTATLFGLVASAATVIAMGAQHVEASPLCSMLVHCSAQPTFVYEVMTADQVAATIKDMQRTQNFLEQVDNIIANIYALRTGRKATDLLELMKKDEWLNMDTAQAWGFVHTISPDPAPTASALRALTTHHAPKAEPQAGPDTDAAPATAEAPADPAKSGEELEALRNEIAALRSEWADLQATLAESPDIYPTQHDAPAATDESPRSLLLRMRHLLPS